MAYVCDDCPSPPIGSIIMARLQCAELTKCFVLSEKIRDDGEIVEKIDHFHWNNSDLLFLRIVFAEVSSYIVTTRIVCFLDSRIIFYVHTYF